MCVDERAQIVECVSSFVRVALNQSSERVCSSLLGVVMLFRLLRVGKKSARALAVVCTSEKIRTSEQLTCWRWRHRAAYSTQVKCLLANPEASAIKLPRVMLLLLLPAA